VEWDIDSILGTKVVEGKRQWEVKWVGADRRGIAWQNTWEPIENLNENQASLRDLAGAWAAQYDHEWEQTQFYEIVDNEEGIDAEELTSNPATTDPSPTSGGDDRRCKRKSGEKVKQAKSFFSETGTPGSKDHTLKCKLVVGTLASGEPKAYGCEFKTSGNTSNMWSHMQRRHLDVYKQMQLHGRE
jgi:hypothetical protein